MKRFIVVLAVMLLASVALAGEKEELGWQYRALVAEFNAAQQRLPQFQALTEFMQQLDKKGLMIKDGLIIEKPKLAPREAPKK